MPNVDNRFKDTRVLRVSDRTQASIIDTVRQWQHRKDWYHTFYTKMEAIDRAYYRYRSHAASPTQDGVDVPGLNMDVNRSKAGDRSAELDSLDFEMPVLVAQIDTIKAYLTDVFLSGNPMFPVVTTPENTEAAEQMETLTQSHVERGRWIHHFLQFFLDCGKYNLGAIELEWLGLFDISVTDRIQQSALRPFADTVGGVQRSLQYQNRVRVLDMYNLIWDRRVAPSEVGTRGEYIGYNELVNYIDLMQRLKILEAEGRLINGDDALASIWADAAKPEFWRDRPIVSRYITTFKTQDWFAWAHHVGGVHTSSIRADVANTYMVTTMYLRMVPDDHHMKVPEGDLPQIWKVTIVNMQVIVQFDPVITAFDHFPIYLGSFLQDGFDYQTQSVGEGLQIVQDLASDLINTRLASSRRSVGDRLIYDPMLISADSIANRDPAARIPMKNSAQFMGKTPADAVFQIPYEDRNVANVMNDMEIVIGLGEWITGLNQFRQGQTRPGNRTLGEFAETIGNSELRSMLIAWTMEDLVFAPLKEQLKFNILRFATDQEILSERLERVVQIDPATIRRSIVEFQLADGLTPKNKLANTDAYVAFLNLFSTVPQLAAQYDMGRLAAYLASLLGAIHIDRFRLDAPGTGVPGAQPPVPEPQAQPGTTGPATGSQASEASPAIQAVPSGPAAPAQRTG